MQGRSSSGHDQMEELKRPAGVSALSLVTSCRREKLLLLVQAAGCKRKKRKERLGPRLGKSWRVARASPLGSASLNERLRRGREQQQQQELDPNHQPTTFVSVVSPPVFTLDCSFLHLSAISSSRFSILASPSPTSWRIATRSRSLPSPPGTNIPSCLPESYANSDIAESWYRLVRSTSL